MSVRPRSTAVSHSAVLVIALALAGALGPASCRAGSQEGALSLSDPADLTPLELGPGERPLAVATTSLVADVVAQVGGDDVALRALLPRGTDPHAYEPTPSDLRALADAQVVFINGLGLEASLEETIRQVAAGAQVISLSQGVQPRRLPEGSAGAAGRAGVDPHVWFDPMNVAVWAENASRALGALDPAHAGRFAENARRYRAAMLELDRWIHDQVAGIPEAKRQLVTDHDSLGYFAARYGFEVVGAVVPAYSTVAVPSAGEIAQLEEAVSRLGVRAVFVGTTVNADLAERVADDVGVRLVPIYTGSLSPPDGPAATYVDMMRYNVSAIVEALGE